MPRNNLIQVRRGTKSEWSSENPILASGEIGYEVGPVPLMKIGDGSTNWESLRYLNSYSVSSFYNIRGSAIYRGQPVFVAVGSFNDNVMAGTVSLDVDLDLFIGLSTNYCSANEFGSTISYGILDGLNTTGGTSNICDGGETWYNGDRLYISNLTEGQLTKNPSLAFNQKVIAATVINVDEIDGKIFVHGDAFNRGLGDLKDTHFYQLSSDNIIKYNSGGSAWQNFNELDGGIV